MEQAILQVLAQSGGCVQREEALLHAFPRLLRRSERRDTRRHKERATAEAAMSRAIVSLERKGLLVREQNVRSGRTFLRSADRIGLPEWEETARAEEDLAAHCLRIADEWTAFARRSQRRASAVRAERSIDGTETERRADLAEMDRLQGEPRRHR